MLGKAAVARTREQAMTPTPPTRRQIDEMTRVQSEAKASNNKPGDLLDMDWINSLPQPLFVTKYSRDYLWPVIDIEVQTGLLRIDVVGLSETWHWGDVWLVQDGAGREYEGYAFYSDAIPEEREPIAAPSAGTCITPSQGAEDEPR